MENFNDTISTEFFDSLWPVILECNPCDIKSTNASEYFIPEQKYDHIWAHEFLASKCYGDYAPALELNCTKTTEKKTKAPIEEEIEQLPYRGPNAKIVPLDQQLAAVQKDVEIRKKLASDFVNRKFPWYIQLPTYMQDFKLTDEIRQLFKDPFEYKILQNIQHFKCHFMIIDVAIDVTLKYLERWLKFAPYAAIITVIHDPELYGKLKSFNYIFEPILMEDIPEDSWQKVLDRSIQLGTSKAKELFLSDDVSHPLIFVFSHNRGICVCDEFKILKLF